MGFLNSSLGIGHTILLIDDSNLEFQSHNNQLKSKHLVSILPSKKKEPRISFTRALLRAYYLNKVLVPENYLEIPW